MSQDAGIQVPSETTTCPFLSGERGEGIRRCVAKRGDPVEISLRYIDSYCLTAWHETCSLFLRATLNMEASALNGDPGREVRPGIVRRIRGVRTSRGLKLAVATRSFPPVEPDPSIISPEQVSPGSLHVLSEAAPGTHGAENVSIEPKAEGTVERNLLRNEPVLEVVAAEAESPLLVPEREFEAEGSIPGSVPQAEQAIGKTGLRALKVELERMVSESDAAPSAFAPAHEAVTGKEETVVSESQPEPSTGNKHPSTDAEAQPLILDVPLEPLAVQEQHEPTPVAVPIPVITYPADRAAINAEDLVVSGTGETDCTVQLLDWGVGVANAVVQRDGTWSIFLPHADKGDHIYSASAIDRAGHASAQSKLLTLTVVPSRPADPVGPEQGKPSLRERSGLEIVPRSPVETPESQPSVHRVGVHWRAPAAGAMVIVLAGAAFFFVHSRFQPSSQFPTPPIVVEPAPGYVWSFPPAFPGTEYEILTFANPSANPVNAQIRAGGALVHSLIVPPRSGAEVTLNSTLFDRIITVNAPEPITTGSIVTVHGSVRFSRSRTVSSRSQTSKP